MNTIYLSLFAYGLLLVSLSKLPETFWDVILATKDGTLEFWTKEKKKRSLRGGIHQGEALLLTLQEAESKITLGIKILPNTLTKYKFYTDLLEQLFESHRKMGIAIKKFIPEIRRAVTNDLKFERKIFDECLGGVLQFIVIAATTWSFVFLANALINIPTQKSIFLLMFGMQIAGILVFFQTLNWLKKKMFFPFAHALKELYLFNTLMEVGVPLNEVLTRSQILEGGLVKEAQFSNEATRMKKLIERLKETGLSPREEALELIGQVWHLQEENFQKFTKKVQVLKFGILAFFFLPAYFLFMVSIFKFFMEQ